MSNSKQMLSYIEKVMANRLSTQVTFIPGSYDKRFCSGLSPNVEYTEKQIAYLHKCFHKYRRQIKDYEEIKSKI
jgi:hypothetical protein